MLMLKRVGRTYAVPAIVMPRRRLFAILTARPLPESPQWVILAPISFKNRSARSNLQPTHGTSQHSIFH